MTHQCRGSTEKLHTKWTPLNQSGGRGLRGWNDSSNNSYYILQDESYTDQYTNTTVEYICITWENTTEQDVCERGVTWMLGSVTSECISCTTGYQHSHILSPGLTRPWANLTNSHKGYQLEQSIKVGPPSHQRGAGYTRPRCGNAQYAKWERITNRQLEANGVPKVRRPMMEQGWWTCLTSCIAIFFSC